MRGMRNIVVLIDTDEDRRSMLEKLCLILRVTGASHERVCDAISRGEFSDFEDCL